MLGFLGCLAALWLSSSLCQRQSYIVLLFVGIVRADETKRGERALCRFKICGRARFGRANQSREFIKDPETPKDVPRLTIQTQFSCGGRKQRSYGLLASRLGLREPAIIQISNSLEKSQTRRHDSVETKSDEV